MLGTTHDLTLGYTYNPGSQIAANTRSNDLYAWGGHYDRNKTETSNGLNQLTAQGSTSLTYDARGNVNGIGANSFAYTAENVLTYAPGKISLLVDSLNRPVQGYDHVSGLYTRFDFDGLDMIAEHNGSNVLQRRYVFGPGTDEPIVWYEGSGTTDRRWLHADERGSIIAVSNGSGAVTNINSYDEYGVPATGNVGRFQYTGQAWLPELGMYYYKARIYNPGIGRFMQTDPIGYAAGMNLYAYVTGDPVMRADPSGMVDEGGIITVTGCRSCYAVSGTGPFFQGGTNLDGMIQTSLAKNGVAVAKNVKQKNGCSPAGAAARARANAGASNFGPVTYNSPNEMALLTQYFQGDTTPYRLSSAEMSQAQSYVGTYGNSVMGSSVTHRADGLTERAVYFGKIASDAPLLDGLLGTATGIFSGGNLVGIRDTFNFDFKDRGGYPYGTFANLGVAMVRLDAASCAGNVSIPVSGGVQ